MKNIQNKTALKEDIIFNKVETTILQMPYNKWSNQEIENSDKNNNENDGSYHCANVAGESGKEETTGREGNKSDRCR